MSQKYCLHDGYPYDGDSYFFPTNYNNNFYTINKQEQFCSLGCALKWALTTKKNSGQMVTFKNMCKDVYGVYSLTPSPARKMLSIFNGAFSIEEFRSKSTKGHVVVAYHNKQLPFKDDIIKYKEFERKTHNMPPKPKVSNNLMKLLKKKRKKTS